MRSYGCSHSDLLEPRFLANFRFSDKPPSCDWNFQLVGLPSDMPFFSKMA